MICFNSGKKSVNLRYAEDYPKFQIYFSAIKIGAVLFTGRMYGIRFLFDQNYVFHLTVMCQNEECYTGGKITGQGFLTVLIVTILMIQSHIFNDYIQLKGSYN